MPVALQYERSRLTAVLSGEIDHHNAAFLREQIDQAICKLHPPALRLDFGAVTFMDSSAVGLVMGRYKAMAGGGALEVTNLSPAACKMMRMANLQSLARLRCQELTPDEKEEEAVLV